jgi:hypothetical protein
VFRQEQIPLSFRVCVDSGWTVLVVYRDQASQTLAREQWDCAIPKIRSAEAAVREAVDPASVVLISAQLLLAPTEVAALGLKPGEIRKRRQ